jgi:hypothetical protein
VVADKKARLTQREINSIKVMKRKGLPYSHMAKHFGRSVNTIKAYCAKVTPTRQRVSFRKLPVGVKLPALGAYLRAGGNPKTLRRVDDLVFQDTEIRCGKELLGQLVVRWRIAHLIKQPEWLQLAYRAIDFYYSVYPHGKGGIIQASKVWPTILRNIKLLEAGEPIEPDWVKFFELLGELKNEN